MSYILDLLFPRSCSQCGRLGVYLCPQCSQHLTRKGISTSEKSLLEGHLSLFRYRGLIKSAITELKFKFVSDIVDEISLLVVHSLVNYYPRLLRYWQQNNFVISPIPLHPRRQLWRGYNQSELLASKIASELNMSLATDLISRIKNNSPQSLVKDRRRRRHCLYKSFSCSVTTPPSNIILFDDVRTSGATINSAASVLPTGCHIWGLSLAG